LLKIRAQRLTTDLMVIRMKISGQKTDSMERRYNIVDSEDLSLANALPERRRQGGENVAAPGNSKKTDHAA
jgi:hypothetical protein